MFTYHSEHLCYEFIFIKKSVLLFLLWVMLGVMLNLDTDLDEWESLMLPDCRWRKRVTWSGYLRWLFSCSWYISCPTSTCFIYILLTWLTFLHLFSTSSPHDCQRSNEGFALCWFPWWPMSPPDIRFPDTGHLLPLGSEDYPHVPPAFCTQWDVTPRPCFRRIRSPLSVKPLMALCWLQVLSLVLKLDTYRPWRPAVCSPTEVSWKISF